MKKNIATGLSLAILLTGVIAPSTAFAASSEVSVQDAKKAALFHVILDQKTNSDSPWKHKSVKVDTPIPVYDASETQVSYLINLTADGKPAGFVEVSDDLDEYPILSFSTSGETMTSD